MKTFKEWVILEFEGDQRTARRVYDSLAFAQMPFDKFKQAVAQRLKNTGLGFIADDNSLKWAHEKHCRRALQAGENVAPENLKAYNLSSRNVA